MSAIQTNSTLFAEFPAHSHVWIYQASRLLTENESNLIREKAKQFVLGWNAHKQPLTADADVVHNLFLVLVTDEEKTGASGCSIDSSVHFVKAVGQEFQIDFFDRLSVSYKTENGIFLANYQQLIEKIKSGILNKDISVFNNVIQTKGELENAWLIPIEKSWLGRLIING